MARRRAISPDTAEKYRDVVRLRAEGKTFDEIADEVGYSGRASAKTAYDTAIARWGGEAVDSLRTIEGERLEMLWRKVVARMASNPSTGEMVALVNAGVQVSRRRAALFGLDAPQQVEVELVTEQTAERAREKAAAIEATLADPPEVPALGVAAS